MIFALLCLQNLFQQPTVRPETLLQTQKKIPKNFAGATSILILVSWEERENQVQFPFLCISFPLQTEESCVSLFKNKRCIQKAQKLHNENHQIMRVCVLSYSIK